MDWYIINIILPEEIGLCVCDIGINREYLLAIVQAQQEQIAQLKNRLEDQFVSR